MEKFTPDHDSELSSEWNIWHRFKQGNHQAFETLYKDYFKILNNYGSRLTSDSQLLEDAIHDVFIDLWRRKEYLGFNTTFDEYPCRSPFPIMRLADLYLLYAEALNETTGPDGEVYRWLDMVRKRAGLKGVVESWTKYSSKPSKVATKEGLREIIQRERLIELVFESKRFWDLRRWKVAENYLQRSINGWDITQREAVNYYRVRHIFSSSFSLKDYFWPISESSLIVNPNLVQNPGW